MPDCHGAPEQLRNQHRPHMAGVILTSRQKHLIACHPAHRFRMPAAERSAPGDAPLLAQLAQFRDATGRAKEAEALYERVLRLDPVNAAATANLAIYRMRSGRQAEAISLWKDAFARNPGLSGVGINLAVAQWNAGDATAARTTLQRVSQFHPDLDPVKQLLRKAQNTK